MSDDKKIKIKENKNKSVQDKDKKDWVIVSVEKKEVNFGAKPEKGKTESTDTVEVKYRKKDETKEEQIKTEKVNVIYDSGWLFKNAKLPTKIGELELKEPKSLDVEGFQPGFWIGSGVLVAVILFLGYWWFSSSRKEDKEEEGL